jgi:hypothetical protein
MKQEHIFEKRKRMKLEKVKRYGFGILLLMFPLKEYWLWPT